MLFDITNRTSFESVTQWHREVLEKVKLFDIIFLVVGCRSDLVPKQQVMPGRKRSWLPLWVLAVLRPWPKATATSAQPLGCSFKRSTRPGERGYGAKFRAGGNEKQGPISGQASRQRRKAGQGGCPHAGDPWTGQPHSPPHRSPRNPHNPQGLRCAQDGTTLGTTEGHDPEVLRCLVSSA